MTEKGLYSKYLVVNPETGEVLDNCFVLRPKKDPAAIQALELYARECGNYKLADDIMYWLASPDINPPLTMEDLKHMHGETIFTTHQGYVICWGIDPNPTSPWGPRIDCGEGRGISLHGFEKDWQAYRRRPAHLFTKVN